MSNPRQDLADILMRTDPLHPAVMARGLYEHMADAVIGAGWSPPDRDAFGMATVAAVKLGTALAEFQNALDALAKATPHCEECHWATSQGHRKSCRSQATISEPV